MSWLFILYVLIFLPDAHASDECNHVLKQMVAARAQIAANQFKVNRSLTDYLEDLDPQFAKRLEEATDKSHWLDLGAGEAYAIDAYFGNSEFRSIHPEAIAHPSEQKAIKQLIEKFQMKPYAKKAKATAITYQLNRTDVKKLPKKMQILSKRFFEDIPNEEIGAFDIATDVVGIASYTTDPSKYFSKVVQLMKNDGTYFSLLSERGEVRTASGNKNFIEWIQSIKGLSVKVVDEYGLSKITIRRKNASVEIPVLQFISTDSGIPPTRVFQETSEKIILK